MRNWLYVINFNVRYILKGKRSLSQEHNPILIGLCLKKYKFKVFCDDDNDDDNDDSFSYYLVIFTGCINFSATFKAYA